ncbi:MBL fold metallo-hydrolase [Vibrio nitrifigilis]|uniref:Ribonuclease Z n=1 Tax=Vibrio nitrifigilis TaxID=2789781 RepID=A0ABS0GK00_9VIBR|nr:ribonuclease Z [Vibrio nitrifigilis]MBF9002771.1 ribonuclease Z [Vibrio nitrifigilis]
MIIDVLGCGSAFAKESNTSAILVQDLNTTWLIDCGPTIPCAIWQRDMNINDIDVIYFTHIHPDHCAGLPALLGNWKAFKRTKPLTIFCQSKQQQALESLVKLASWPGSNLPFTLHWQSIEDQFIWDEWNIKTAFTQHEVSNRALRIDNGTNSLFYSGDGRPTKESQLLMKNVDIAFQECACFDALPEGDSHGDLPQCVRLCEQLTVPVLVVYHCWDEHLDAIRREVSQHRHLAVSRDGWTINLSQPLLPQL